MESFGSIGGKGVRAFVLACVVALVAAVMACVTLAPAGRALAATDMLDPDATGSVTVALHDADGKVAGGELSIYKVASAVSGDTGWHFVWDGAYTSMGDDLSTKSGALTASYASSLASRLTPLVEGRAADASAHTDADGSVTFAELEVGMYLVTETSADSGYTTIDPFVVTVPVEDATTGALVYDVNASPKAGSVEKVQAPETPETPAPTTPAVPKTGDTWAWQSVIALGVAGAVLVVCGCILASRRRA